MFTPQVITNGAFDVGDGIQGEDVAFVAAGASDQVNWKKDGRSTVFMLWCNGLSGRFKLLTKTM